MGGIPELSNNIKNKEFLDSNLRKLRLDKIYKNPGLKKIRSRRQRIKEAFEYYRQPTNITLFKEYQ